MELTPAQDRPSATQLRTRHRVFLKRDLERFRRGVPARFSKLHTEAAIICAATQPDCQGPIVLRYSRKPIYEARSRSHDKLHILIADETARLPFRVAERPQADTELLLREGDLALEYAPPLVGRAKIGGPHGYSLNTLEAVPYKSTGMGAVEGAPFPH